jgi:single-strand DNA-binding protein
MEVGEPCQLLSKGKQVYVEGRLQTRSYEDRDGVKRYVTEIVADGVILLGGQQAGAQDQHASSKNGLVSQPRGRAVAPGASPAGDSSGQEVTDADIPF